MSRETVGHLQSAYCEGQAKAVTNALHNCFRELQYDQKKRWQREKPDGVAIDMKKKIFTIIEYKRRSETWPDYKERREENPREQYEAVREALQIAGDANG